MASLAFYKAYHGKWIGENKAGGRETTTLKTDVKINNFFFYSSVLYSLFREYLLSVRPSMKHPKTFTSLENGWLPGAALCLCDGFVQGCASLGLKHTVFSMKFPKNLLLSFGFLKKAALPSPLIQLKELSLAVNASLAMQKALGHKGCPIPRARPELLDPCSSPELFPWAAGHTLKKCTGCQTVSKSFNEWF